jgi:hypothetical protein
METGNPLHQALVRRRFTPRAAEELVQNVEAQRDDDSEYKAFTFGRVGPRPQMTLILGFAGGHGRGFPYAQMLGIEFDDEDAGFRLEFPGQIVEIRGRNLKRLLRYVCDHRAARVEESTPQQSLAATNAAEIVDSIVVRRLIATAKR